MWVFTETGFVSAVAHRDNPEILIVRSRDRHSIEPLALLARQTLSPGQVLITPTASAARAISSHNGLTKTLSLCLTKILRAGLLRLGGTILHMR